MTPKGSERLTGFPLAGRRWSATRLIAAPGRDSRFDDPASRVRRFEELLDLQGERAPRRAAHELGDDAVAVAGAVAQSKDSGGAAVELNSALRTHENNRRIIVLAAVETYAGS